MTDQIISLGAVMLLAAMAARAAVTDIRGMIIPDSINIAIFVTGMLASALSATVDPVSALSGAAAGGSAALALRFGFHALRGYHGLGLGDVKFIAATATWVGLEGLPLALSASSICALVYLGICKLSARQFDITRPLPFGPFLGIGFSIVASGQILSGFTWLQMLERWPL